MNLFNLSKFELWAKAKDYEYNTGNQAYRYFLDKESEVIVIDPMPIDQLKCIYPDNYYSFGESKGFFSWLVFLKLIIDSFALSLAFKRTPYRDINILEIGGSGHLLNLLKKINKRVRCTAVVDLNPSLQVVAHSYGHDFYCGKFEDISFPSSSFNIALAYNLIEHVESPVDFLRRMYDILEDDGLVVLQTPNWKCLDSKIFKSHYWAGLHCPRHWHLYSQQSLRNLASASGFSVDKFKYIQGSSFLSASVVFFLNEKFGFAFGGNSGLASSKLFVVLSVLLAPFEIIRSFFMPTSQMQVFLRKAKI